MGKISRNLKGMIKMKNSSIEYYFYFSHLILLKEEVERTPNGRMEIINKFKFACFVRGKTFYVKVNLADNQFYVFTPIHNLYGIYVGFESLKEWIHSLKESRSLGVE
jgi:hypothetical protein